MRAHREVTLPIICKNMELKVKDTKQKRFKKTDNPTSVKDRLRTDVARKMGVIEICLASKRAYK